MTIAHVHIPKENVAKPTVAIANPSLKALGEMPVRLVAATSADINVLVGRGLLVLLMNLKIRAKA